MSRSIHFAVIVHRFLKPMLQSPTEPWAGTIPTHSNGSKAPGKGSGLKDYRNS